MAADRRNAIITGAASGLGRAIALRLARDGWQMALVDVNDAANDETLRLVRSRGRRRFYASHGCRAARRLGTIA